PQDQPRGCGGTPSHHVLVTTADVGGHDLQDRPVWNLAPHVARSNAGSVLEFELRVGDVGDLDLAGTLVHHTSVAAHVPLPCLSAPVRTVGGWSSPLIQRGTVPIRPTGSKGLDAPWEPGVYRRGTPARQPLVPPAVRPATRCRCAKNNT